ncbi:FliH/SctL family protein [Microbacterium hydrocarbonoxydans]|uniref:FliH/SctL family protein n=1 Tax=Microbacterium hydrocarbonoxydans TaxID=273678 RepID=UPI00203CB521|nr:FliH/SctL family protein [Microbacterium hydrocarbonoxydans]MCM3780514.1 FliH/SctL family protein [Microbacterium hydrocarbonoxydans]
MLDSVFTPLAVPRVGATPIDIRSEADRARTRGYAEGFAEGRRIAAEQARVEQEQHAARVEALTQAFGERARSAVVAVHGARSALEQRVDDVASLDVARIEELAVELAIAIVGVELSDPARSAAHALRRALVEVPQTRWTRIVFSERDLAALQEVGALATMSDVEIVSSSAVDDGGVIVDIGDGSVDARIAPAFARARSALLGVDDEPSEVTL